MFFRQQPELQISKNIRVNEPGDVENIVRACQCRFNPYFDVCIARNDDDGTLLGGVIYEGYTGENGSVTCHVAGFDPHWVNRDMLWICFDYPFNKMKVRYMFGQVPSKNQEALEFDLNLGFKIVTIIEGAYPDDDMVLLRMGREDCRFLNIRPRGVLDGRKI